MLLPQTPEAAAGHIAIYKLGAVAVPLAILFGVDALSYRLQNAGVKAVITNAQGAREARRDPRRAAGPRAGALDRRAGRRRARISTRRSRAASDRLHAGRHDAGRSRADDLHLRHDRPGEGRAARASRAARTSARHRDAARFFPARRRPVLDAGRLGLGRRPARLPAAEPAPRRAGGGAQVREVRSRGSLRAAGARPACATPSSRRPRCACCARRRARAGATTSGCARSARAAKRSAPRPTNGAARRFGLTINEFYGQTECNLVLSSCAMIGVSKPGAIGKPVPGHDGRGDPPRRLARRRRRARADRGEAAGPGDVPRILGPAGGDARRNSSATG